MKRKHIALTLLAMATLLAGCGGGGSNSSSGGGGGSGPGGGGTTGPLVSTAITVTLPTGTALVHGKAIAKPASIGQLRLSGGKFDPVAVTGGTATITTWASDRELVAAIDANNNPVLLGFVGPGHTTLDAHSTAVALTYFAIGGYTGQYESNEANLEQLEQDTNVAKAAASISTTLQTDGNLSSPTAAYRAAITTSAGDVLGAQSTPAPALKLKHQAVAINPSDTPKSGVTVNYGSGDSQIQASNTFRRRVMMFVDQSSTTANGVTTNTWVPVASSEIDPAKGTVNPFDLIGNLGDLDPVTSSSVIAVPALASGLSATDYTVTVAGPGLTATTSPSLTTAEQTKLSHFLEAAFVKDYFLPLFNVFMANAATFYQSNQVPIYQALEGAVDNQSLAVQSFVETNFPTSVTKMDSGDYPGAMSDVIAAMKSSNNTALAAFYSNITPTSLPGQATAGRTATIISWMSKVIANPPTQNVLLPQQHDINASNTFDTWDVQVNTAKVSLTPATATVTNTNISQLTTLFTANVTYPGGLPAGSTITYDWSTTGNHGDITVDTTPGVKFLNQKSDSALYGATLGLTASTGTDTVEVEATLTDSQGHKTKLGGAHATATVNGDGQVTLLPKNISVKPGDTSSTIVAQTDEQITAGTSPGTGQFQWSLSPSSLGTLSVGTGLTTQGQVVITAGTSSGNGTLTCNLVDNSSGKTVATSSCNIKVESKTTVVHGTLQYGTYSKPGGGSSWGIWVQFPVVPGTKSVSMSCYNFNDGAWWHTGVGASGTSGDGGKTWSWQGGDDITPNGTDAGPAGSTGNLYFGLTGGNGAGPANGADVAAEMNQRFHGMIIEATYTY